MSPILKCILCEGKLLDETTVYTCELCKYTYPYNNGILITDTTIDTMLNITDYISEKSNGKPIYNFIDFFKAIYEERGSLLALEVAGGPGNLTKQALEHNLFSELWSSDISVEFLKYQQTIIHSPVCKFVQMNASNMFPFADNSLDVVYGNSCLHHFLHYDVTLSECFRVLKPGGIAIFGEPISTGNQPIWLMLSLIAEFDKTTSKPTFTQDQYRRIIQIQKDAEMLHTLAKTKQYDLLGKFEDKYLYNIEELENLSKTMGFSTFQTIKDITPSSYLYHPTIQTYTEQVELYTQTIIKDWKLPLHYLWIVELVYDSIIKPNLGTNSCALFTVFCMKK